MFTGLISSTANLVLLEKKEQSRLVIRAREIKAIIKIGDSMAVNGACLTLIEIGKNEEYAFFISAETLEKSNFKDLAAGALLNIELPLTLQDFLSGHLVSGHVEGTARVRSIFRGSGKNRFSFTYNDPQWRSFLVPKGSVALNGISLTLVDVHPTWFSVEVIPHTLKSTNFHLLRIGDRVNVELDFLAKYIYNFIHSR